MEEKNKRIGWIDELRGLAICAMILYHIAFNMLYFLHLPLPWLRLAMESRWLGVLHVLFVAVFLGLSGICSHLTRRPWHRAGRVLCGAAVVTVVTFFAFPEQAIWFGVLHCLGVCMALEAFFGKYLRKIKPLWGLVISLALFILSYRVPEGYILTFALPDSVYMGGILTVVGFPDRFFSSLDYVPLLPHIFLFSAGVFLGCVPLPERGTHCRLLAFCGRHSLAVYLLHQPVVFGVFFLLGKILA